MDSLDMESITRQEVMALPSDERDTYIIAYMKERGIVAEKTKTMTNLPPGVDVGDFVNHIDYMVKLIGINHEGISSDFDVVELNVGPMLQKLLMLHYNS